MTTTTDLTPDLHAAGEAAHRRYVNQSQLAALIATGGAALSGEEYASRAALNAALDARGAMFEARDLYDHATAARGVR